MYGSRRVEYDPASNVDAPTDLLEPPPLDGGGGPGFFDFTDDNWPPASTNQNPSSVMDLDSVNDLERDLLDFAPSYAPISNPTSLTTREPAMADLGTIMAPRGSQNLAIPANHSLPQPLPPQLPITPSLPDFTGRRPAPRSVNINHRRDPAMRINGLPNLSNLPNLPNLPTNIPNGMQNGIPNGMQNGIPNGMPNGIPDGALNLDPLTVQRPHVLPRRISNQIRRSDPTLRSGMNSPPIDPITHQMRLSSPHLSTSNVSSSTSLSSVNTPIPRHPLPSPGIQVPVSELDPVSPCQQRRQRCRLRYKPASSIPPDLSSANYAAQCIAAAESSRLPPYSLSVGEFNHLRTKLPYVHITTYLNIRNGVLRLWLANPLVAVTMVEAAGCCRDARYYLLAEFAFEWLVRNGYINHGCCAHQTRLSASAMMAEAPQFSLRRRKPRQTIVVIGAGIAGLSCARQLENLLERYALNILKDYEDLPRVMVLEGRRRLGGRVYSPVLRTNKLTVDLGADTIAGFGGGNPMGVLLRRQLGIPVVSLDTTSAANVLFDQSTGDPIDAQQDYRAHEIFKHLLDRMRNFEMGQDKMTQMPANAPGIKSLIRAGQDPPLNLKAELTTISNHEETVDRPYTKQNSDASDDEDSGPEIKLELDFLRSLGLPTAPQVVNNLHAEVRVHAEPADQGASLGLTMRKLVEQISTLTSLSDGDRQALNWYLAKFEYLIGDDIDQASLSTWSHHRQNRFTGRHAWARDGMSSLVRGLDAVPTKLDTRFKTAVTVVEYEEDSAQITLENGEQMQADRVVVTTPLGCLKKRSLQFIPDLPQWKLDSIDRLEFGVVNKVVLQFDELFWDASVPSTIRVTGGVDAQHRGECFIFQNHSRRQDPEGKALIVGLVSGESAKNMNQQSDAEIIEPAVSKLRKIFRNHPKAHTAKLVESVVTRWQNDRFSRGAFSHVGTEGTTTDHDLLAKPVLRSLFFAGEATSRMYPGTIHGAYISGLRAAKEVLTSLVGGIELPDSLLVEDVEAFTKTRETSVSSTGGDPIMELNNASKPHFGGSTPSFGGSAPNFGNGGYSLASAQKLRPPFSRNNTQSRAPSPGSDSNYGTPPVADMMASSQNALSVNGIAKRSGQSPEHAYEHLDISRAESELADLRKRRNYLDNEHLNRDLLHQLGPLPTRPERQGTTNPFLLFQKDYWDICRQETEASKRNDRKSGVFHASRNEIRQSLGKKWRSLPEAERAPYIERSQRAKLENEERQEAYIRKLKWYETEAANFRQQWVQEHQSAPSLRERYLEEQLEECRPRKKRTRLTE